MAGACGHGRSTSRTGNARFSAVWSRNDEHHWSGTRMKRNVTALEGELFDLAILGGGITGAGVALDAALRGLRVALIDKGDFASGTSSASSKLVQIGRAHV